MKSKRSFLASVLVISFGLVGLSGWLILNPIVVFAASCTANCSNGRTVMCGGGNATVATCIDNRGCTSNLNGSEAKSCNSSGSEEEESP